MNATKALFAKKLGVAALLIALVASFGLFGCSNSDSKDSEATSGDYTLLNDGTLVVGLSPDYPPFENLEGDELVGFEVDLGKALAEELGLEYENKNLQFDAIIPAVVAGGQVDIGMSGFTVTPERAEQIDFTESFYIDDQAVAVMKDEGITKDNAESALNQEGVIIAVQSGTTGETYAQENYPNAVVQPYGNSTDCFAAMQSGQANAVCTNKAVVEKMIKDAYQNAEIVATSATGEEYAIVVSKDNPQLTEALNAAIQKLKDNGKIDELIAKWL
jgi:polar amino acid transport system substrate-binding protein